MKNKQLIVLVVGVALVVGLIAGIIGANLTGNVIVRQGWRSSTVEVATKTEVLNMLKYNCDHEVFSSRVGWWSMKNELDLNGDTVVTGDEFCKVSTNSICLWKRRISYNTFTGLRNNGITTFPAGDLRENVITSVTGETTGCGGGESNQFYEDNYDEGMEIFCCSL